MRRLVFAVYDAKGHPKTIFRVAEHRSLAGRGDAALDLPDSATIGLVHRLELDDKTSKQWSQILADYEIVPPFDQLTRETYSAKATSKVIDDFAGKTVPTKRVLELENRGWRRGTPMDAGWIGEMRKPLGGDMIASIVLEDGILAQSLAESPEEQTLGPIELTPKGTRPKALDPIVYGEIVRDVALITTKM